MRKLLTLLESCFGFLFAVLVLLVFASVSQANGFAGRHTAFFIAPAPAPSFHFQAGVGAGCGQAAFFQAPPPVSYGGAMFFQGQGQAPPVYSGGFQSFGAVGHVGFQPRQFLPAPVPVQQPGVTIVEQRRGFLGRSRTQVIQVR
jgi:hypothetical protein